MEADTAIMMHQLELQASSGRTTVGEQSSTMPVASFDVSKNVSLIPVLSLCASLSVEDSLDYDEVKRAILHVYELLPEAYRERFRGLRKGPGQNLTLLERKAFSLIVSVLPVRLKTLLQCVNSCCWRTSKTVCRTALLFI